MGSGSEKGRLCAVTNGKNAIGGGFRGRGYDTLEKVNLMDPIEDESTERENCLGSSREVDGNKGKVCFGFFLHGRVNCSKLYNGQAGILLKR